MSVRRRCIRPKTLTKRVVDALEDASELYDGRGWLGITQESWKIGRILQYLPQIEELKTTTVAQLCRGEVELEYTLRLLEALRSSAAELLADCKHRLQPVVSKLSKSFASLPDELLSIIFKFACHHEQEGTRYANWLSQVSRRFRGIVLADCTLWTTQCLWYDSTKDSIERCISRCRQDSDLHLAVNSNETMICSLFDATDLFATCLPFSSRWRTLTLTNEWIQGEADDLSTVGDFLGWSVIRKHWALPHLYELVLNQRVYDEKIQRLVWLSDDPDNFNHPSCSAPNLRILRCTQYIPPPSFPFKSITNFELSFTLILPGVMEQIRDLLRFLSSMETLTTVSIELVNTEDMDYDDYSNIGQVFKCRGVKSFRLAVTGFLLVNGASSILGLVIEALRMPRLECLSLFIHLRATDFIRGSFGDGYEERHLPDLISSLLPHPHFHKDLTSVTIDVPLPDYSDDSDKFTHVHLTIPLHKVLRVSTMQVTSFCRVSFSCENDEGESIRVRNSRLRELLLERCTRMNTQHLQDMVQSLKDVDAWDVLESVGIRECELLDYESALEVVGKKKLRFAS